MSKPRDPRARMTVDTVELTPASIKVWKAPPFQRPLRVNDKVRALVDELKANGGVIPGVLTIGKLGKDYYLLDGQHRLQAFALSEMATGYADIRQADFESLGDMGKEYVRLNSQMVRMRPDDILRGFEQSHAPLALIRRKCPFVGYDYIRRYSGDGKKAPTLLSLALVLRSWDAATSEVPHPGGIAAAALADEFTYEEAEKLCAYLLAMYDAWGADAEYARLWAGLNLTVVAWLWRRMVLKHLPSGSRVTVLTPSQFVKAARALSADNSYLDWLRGRLVSDRDRAPCLNRIKAIFNRRLADEFPGKKLQLPQPAWGHWQNPGRRQAA